LRLDQVILIGRGCGFERVGIHRHARDIVPIERWQVLAFAHLVDGHPAIRDGLHVKRPALFDVGSEESIRDVFHELLRPLQRANQLRGELLFEVHAPTVRLSRTHAVRLQVPERHRTVAVITFDLGIPVATDQRVCHQRGAKLEARLLRVRCIVKQPIEPMVRIS
jgi:hypothetical protein